MQHRGQLPRSACVGGCLSDIVNILGTQDSRETPFAGSAPSTTVGTDREHQAERALE